MLASFPVPMHSHGVRTTIAVVDDDPGFRTYLRRKLEEAHYFVRTWDFSGLNCAVKFQPELLILSLDAGQPGSRTAIEYVREQCDLPVIAISMQTDEESKVEALEAGADDYVEKPVSIRGLLARIRIIQRRIARQNGERSIFVSGDLKVDPVQRRVWKDDLEVQLSPKPFEVLRLLVIGTPGPIHHDVFLSSVWRDSKRPRRAYLRLAIRQLRAKLESDPRHPVHIQTVTRIGYRLV